MKVKMGSTRLTKLWQGSLVLRDKRMTGKNKGRKWNVGTKQGNPGKGV